MTQESFLLPVDTDEMPALQVSQHVDAGRMPIQEKETGNKPRRLRISGWFGGSEKSRQIGYVQNLNAIRTQIESFSLDWFSTANAVIFLTEEARKAKGAPLVRQKLKRMHDQVLAVERAAIDGKRVWQTRDQELELLRNFLLRELEVSGVATTTYPITPKDVPVAIAARDEDTLVMQRVESTLEPQVIIDGLLAELDQKEESFFTIDALQRWVNEKQTTYVDMIEVKDLLGDVNEILVACKDENRNTPADETMRALFGLSAAESGTPYTPEELKLMMLDLLTQDLTHPDKGSAVNIEAVEEALIMTLLSVGSTTEQIAQHMKELMDTLGVAWLKDKSKNMPREFKYVGELFLIHVFAALIYLGNRSGADLAWILLLTSPAVASFGLFKHVTDQPMSGVVGRGEDIPQDEKTKREILAVLTEMLPVIAVALVWFGNHFVFEFIVKTGVDQAAKNIGDDVYTILQAEYDSIMRFSAVTTALISGVAVLSSYIPKAVKNILQ